MANSSWFQRVRSRLISPRTLSSRRPVRRRPTVEALEARCVPSTFTVNNPDDNVAETHTLRWAVANSGDGDSIQITPALQGTPIVLTQGELVLNHSVTVEAVGNKLETIRGGGMSRIFEIAGGANVTIEGLTIIAGNGVAQNPSGTGADDGLGGGILNFGTLTVIGSRLAGNSATFAGGGILNFGTLMVSGSTLDGNSGGVGVGGVGGAIANATALTVSDSTLSGNSADVGGGVFNDGSLTVCGSAISNNLAGSQGGGIDMNGGTGTVTASILAGNIVTLSNGGGIANSAVLTVSDCILSGNSAASGGAIANDGPLTVSNCILSRNSAAFDGGGILAAAFGAPTEVINCIISDNSAANKGGGIANFGALAISGSILAGNSADSGGGVYNFAGGILTISGSTLTGNSTSSNGGAIYNEWTLTVSNCLLTDNSATLGGGGIFNQGGAALTVSGSTFFADTPDSILGAFFDGGGNTFS
jgi:hypothetical protein